MEGWRRKEGLGMLTIEVPVKSFIPIRFSICIMTITFRIHHSRSRTRLLPHAFSHRNDSVEESRPRFSIPKPVSGNLLDHGTHTRLALGDLAK